MDRLLTINGKTYKAAEFDLNLMCDFEDAGVSLESIDNKMFSVVRQYVAICMNTDVRVAGSEINEHMKKGGSIDDIIDVMNEMMQDSGFFRQTQTDENQGDSKRTGKKKSESEEVIS